jgi:hypothetical protein
MFRLFLTYIRKFGQKQMSGKGVYQAPPVSQSWGGLHAIGVHADYGRLSRYCAGPADIHADSD